MPIFACHLLFYGFMKVLTAQNKHSNSLLLESAGHVVTDQVHWLPARIASCSTQRKCTKLTFAAYFFCVFMLLPGWALCREK